MGEPEPLREAVRCADGVTLSVRVLPPLSAPRGVVVLGHAMFADGRAFLKPGGGLPAVLTAAGWEVWLPDLRFHGASPAPPCSYDAYVHLDLPALAAAAGSRAEALGGRLVLGGHSLGGQAFAASVAEGRTPAPDALLLIASNPWVPSLDPSPLRRHVKAVTLAFFSGMADERVFPARRLRLGSSDTPRPYVDDFARWWAEDRWASQEGFHWMEALGEVRCPTFAMTGGADRVTAPPVTAFALARRIPGATCHTVSGVNHMGVVTSAAAAPGWAALRDWLG